MEFSRQGYWSSLPFPSPGDLPDTGIEVRSPILQADSLSSEAPGKPSFNINPFSGADRHKHVCQKLGVRDPMAWNWELESKQDEGGAHVGMIQNRNHSLSRLERKPA